MIKIEALISVVADTGEEGEQSSNRADSPESAHQSGMLQIYIIYTNII